MTEVNKLENRKTIEKINGTESQIFKKKINKALGTLVKERRDNI